MLYTSAQPLPKTSDGARHVCSGFLLPKISTRPSMCTLSPDYLTKWYSSSPCERLPCLDPKPFISGKTRGKALSGSDAYKNYLETITWELERGDDEDINTFLNLLFSRLLQHLASKCYQNTSDMTPWASVVLPLSTSNSSRIRFTQLSCELRPKEIFWLYMEPLRCVVLCT